MIKHLPLEISKENVKLNLWIKDIAPSNELKKELIKQIKIIEKFNKTVTLLYSEKDEKYNNATVIMESLLKPQKQIIGKIHGS